MNRRLEAQKEGFSDARQRLREQTNAAIEKLSDASFKLASVPVDIKQGTKDPVLNYRIFDVFHQIIH